MAITIKKKTTEVTDQLQKISKRSDDGRAFLTRIAYPLYQDAQRERWMTENQSQGSGWKPLNPRYAAYKLRRYGGGTKYRWIGGRGDGRPWRPAGNWPSYPGGGRKMMIATGELVASVTGDKLTYHKRVITTRSMIISTTLDYAEDANSKRNFTDFNDRFWRTLMDKYKAYIQGDAQ